MIEARAFVDSIEPARQTLVREAADDAGYYEITDRIYERADGAAGIGQEFLRLRHIPVNIWPEKQVIIARKLTNLEAIGKRSVVPLKLEFDTVEQAEVYYDENLKDEYVFAFSFARVGWQYRLQNGDVVDLEIIEDNFPSIEMKSCNQMGIERLMGLLGVRQSQVIVGPSVVAVRDILISQSN